MNVMDWLKNGLKYLINLGTDKSVDIHTKFRIRFINKMTWLGVVSLWLFSTYHALQGAYLLSFFLVLTSWVLICSIFFLNGKGYNNISPAISLSAAATVIAFSGYYFIGELAVQYILISLTPLPALTINSSKRLMMAITTIYIPALAAILVIFNFEDIGMFTLSKEQHDAYVLMCFLESIVLIVFQAFAFVHEMQIRYDVYLNNQAKINSQTRLSDLGLTTAGIAHEINNPLAVINGAAYILLKKMKKGVATEDDIKKEVNSILGQSDRIIKIIRGLKFVSRDGSEDSFDEWDINQVVEEAVELCHPKLQGHKVIHKFERSHQTCFSKIRVVQIQQVILSIVSNAIDAMEDQIDKGIKVSVNGGELNNIQIVIQDNGPGIPSELREEILKPFFTTKPVGKGTGLGLSVAMEIMQKHGGSLEIGQPDKGAMFILKLPKSEAVKKAA